MVKKRKRKKEQKLNFLSLSIAIIITTRFDGYHVIGGERRTAHQDIRFDNTVPLIATESRVEDDEKEEIRLPPVF